MISSTFYDLKNVRAELSTTIDRDLGYRVLISESSTFPIDPDVTTVENCKRRVTEDADILVLIIGERYGSIDASAGRSVTNLEYLAARAKGIPIYAFVTRQLLTMVELHQKAKPASQAIFNEFVDDPKLFEFVNAVRFKDSVWMNSFESASEIATSLKAQFAYLTHDGLRSRLRLQSYPELAALTRLPPQAFKIALERQELWEHLTFAAILEHEVSQLADLRMAYELGIAGGAGYTIKDDDLFPWLSRKMWDGRRLAIATGTLVTTALPKAFRPPGENGNLQEIAFVARELASVYQNAIEWAQDVRRAHVEEDFQGAQEVLATTLHQMIENLGKWPNEILFAIQEAVAKHKADPLAQINLDITLQFDVDEAQLQKILQEIKAVFKHRGFDLDAVI
jgi:hypothetical protein